MKIDLRKTLSGWKILIAIGLGLIVSGWMVYQSMHEESYLICEDGKGDYVWNDVNNNGIVDSHNPSEFNLQKHGNYKRQTITDSLKNIAWDTNTYFWLILALFLMLSRDFFYIVRIRLLTHNQLNWKAATYVILLWEFASALTPGVVGGAAVAMFILNRETIPFGKATAIVIITAFMDNLFFVVMIPLVFLFIRNQTLFPPENADSLIIGYSFWVGFAVIFSICLLLYLTIFWFPKLATRFLFFIFRLPFLKRWKFIAQEWGNDIERASKEFKQEKRVFWWKVFGATFASWISRYLVINAILHAFIAIGFIDDIIILGKQLVLWLFMLISPTPGGSGVAEYAFGELLTSFSSSAFLIAALAIIWRLISYFPYLFIGAILLPAWLRRTSS